MIKYNIYNKKKKLKNYDKFKIKYEIVHEENPYSEFIRNDFKIKNKKK